MKDEAVEISFSVSGKPVGKGRPRFTRAGGAYTPKQTVDQEKRVAAAAWQAMVLAGYTVTDKSVAAQIVIEAPIPKSWSKGDRLAAELGAKRPGKPDLDNVAKLVLDACNGVVYHDDAQVHHLTISKRYGPGDGQVSVKMAWTN